MTPWHSVLIFFPIAAWLLAALPAYVVGERLGVIHPAEAFIPVVGPHIVILHSIRRSGWLCLLALLPLVSFAFYLWLAWVVPGEHGRTQWWTLLFLVPGVNVVAYYAYAFTLERRTADPPAALATS